MPTNNIPVVTNMTVYVPESTPVPFQLRGQDWDYDDYVKFFIVGPLPSNSKITGNLTERAGDTLYESYDGALTYTPKQYFAGSELIAYYGSDGKGNSTIAYVNFVVVPVNSEL